MSQTSYTADDLKKLPLRAIVAFAVRCARRVEHLAVAPGAEASAAAVAEGLGLAEDFARGGPCPTLESAVGAIEAGRDAAQGEIVRENAYAAVARAIHAAASAARAIAEGQEPAEMQVMGGPAPVQPMAQLAGVSADLAALGAFTAAVDAADALQSTDELSRGAAEDYRRLLGLGLGRYPEAGEPIDPSPDGPLGPIRSGAGAP